MLGALHQATDRTFDEMVTAASPTTTVVDFWSSSCRPCKELERILERIEPELPDQVQILAVSTDDNPELVRRFEIQAVPTLLILSKGVPVARLTGVDRPQVIKKTILQAAGEGESQ